MIAEEHVLNVLGFCGNITTKNKHFHGIVSEIRVYS
jgi:hypothetical protein